ncbi:hypothetical protein CIK05_09430 [Bdellovibrio sp. qaytius]|nr:hypothetical protein CIK05_09430 [Bdellovibrio sp. qaytius]
METKSNSTSHKGRPAKGKLILKVLLICAAVAVISVAGFIAFIVYHLPSRNILSSAIINQGKHGVKAQVAAKPVDTSEPPSVLAPTTAPTVSATAQVVQEQSTSNSNVGLDDLVNPNKPLSNFCSSLKNAKAGPMNNKEAGRAFQASLNEATADPRAQALKPLFRYIVRLPQFQDLIAEVNAAAASGEAEESFTQKASFYAKVVSAFAAMHSHKSDLEAISDRSYLFYNLNKAVAAKPELANDERLKKFCDDTENAFNTDQAVNIEQEKKNFERLLSELNVEQKSIGYDPNYKTTFEFKRDEKSMRLQGGWIEDAFTGEPKTEKSPSK